MKKVLMVIVAIILLLALAISIFGRNKMSDNVSTNQVSPIQEIPLNTVIMKNFAFQPSTLIIKPGTTVTWENQDSAGHDLKSDMFTSPILKKGERFEFTFDTKGTFNYSCGIHPPMVGSIIVE